MDQNNNDNTKGAADQPVAGTMNPAPAGDQPPAGSVTPEPTMEGTPTVPGEEMPKAPFSENTPPVSTGAGPAAVPPVGGAAPMAPDAGTTEEKPEDSGMGGGTQTT